MKGLLNDTKPNNTSEGAGADHDKERDENNEQKLQQLTKQIQMLKNWKNQAAQAGMEDLGLQQQITEKEKEKAQLEEADPQAKARKLHRLLQKSVELEQRNKKLTSDIEWFRQKLQAAIEQQTALEESIKEVATQLKDIQGDGSNDRGVMEAALVAEEVDEMEQDDFTQVQKKQRHKARKGGAAEEDDV
jgi:hypothetical protein